MRAARRNGATAALAAAVLMAGCAAPVPRPTPRPPPVVVTPPPPAPVAQPAPAATPAPPPGVLATPEPAVRVETRTRRGNPPVYTVLGQTYRLLPTVAGYRERGVASWYGPDFHAKSTSNGEAYDMYAMTAAHRTLPIPAYVRVTNLANGRSIVVRVNDRGPFKHNRIIDLSYTAAAKLDMIRDGTALVEVEALLAEGDDGLLPVAGSGPSVATRPAPASAPAPARPPLPPASAPVAAAPTPPPAMTTPVAARTLYAQVGAFGVEANARKLQQRLAAAGIVGASVVEATRNGAPLWRVRVGPVTSVAQFDALVDQLEKLGYGGATLASAAEGAAQPAD